jgi:hypothetical protein
MQAGVGRGIEWSCDRHGRGFVGHARPHRRDNPRSKATGSNIRHRYAAGGGAMRPLRPAAPNLVRAESELNSKIYQHVAAPEAPIRGAGAGEGNRTLVFSLEGCCSTIELHPRMAMHYHAVVPASTPPRCAMWGVAGLQSAARDGPNHVDPPRRAADRADRPGLSPALIPGLLRPRRR